MQRMNIPGEDQKGVLNALEFIASYKTARLRELSGTVVVVGAGNTAIDAANAARRLVRRDGVPAVSARRERYVCLRL